MRATRIQTPVQPPLPQGTPFKPKASATLLPLGAMLLAGSMSAMAQQATGEAAHTLKPVEVKEKAVAAEGKDSVRATSTSIGKGKQELRDIPQSITVVTEKLINDRNLDTMKDVLKNTGGVTFMAAEGGEEDVRLRGFSLATTGDIYIDGMRDPAFYDRDTFNNDRVEVIRGSASMLFGRGSTGGVVNQSSKAPRLVDEHEVSTTVGSYNHLRVTGDFNLKTGDSAALRINAMADKADNNGSGSSIDKRGLAAAYRWGIGEKDEFQASLYSLDNRNGINYGLPWIRPTAAATTAENGLIPGLNPSTYYGMGSDRNYGTANWVGLKHTHRFDDDSELQTRARKGRFTRDQRASAIRFAGTAAAAGQPLFNPVTVTLANLNANTVLNRGTNNKIQDVDTAHVQSDYSTKFTALGYKHEVLAGVDFAQENKTVYAENTVAQGGVNLIKSQTLFGAPNTTAGVAEDSRVLRPNTQYSSRAMGVYAQDMLHLTPQWKLLGGLRFDLQQASYSVFTIPANAAGPVTASPFSQDIYAWSPRIGALYQPDALHSYHVSYGTSVNTSADVYSYTTALAQIALAANTPPESSQNFEIGAKLDSADKLLSTRLALFHSIKNNERNTDPDTSATRLLLSGKRHATGVELDFTGRIAREWEIFVSYAWIPDAAVDVAASTVTTVGNRVGDRPGLTPVHSGTVWSTYQVNPKLRVGGGLNFRSPQAAADVTAPAWEAPGFTTLDLMAEYAFSDRWVLKGNITNVNDTYYGDSLYRGHYVPGAGRLVSMTLTAKF